jgi:hypothetical protein
MHAADLRVMRIRDDRSRETDLGFRERGWISERSKIRNWVIGWDKTIGRDLAKIGDRGLGARISLALGDPQRRIITAGIERVDAYPFVDTADDLVEFSAGKIV